MLLENEKNRTFTINDYLLSEFKEITLKSSKSYKTTVAEAIKLWLKKQKTDERSVCK